MDRQAWIAVALCIIGLVAWQVYTMQHPELARARPTAASPSPNAVATTTATPAVEPTATPAPNEPSPTPIPAQFAEKFATLGNGDLELRLTNRGGGIAEAILPKHKAADGKPLHLNAGDRVPIGAILEKPAAPQLSEFRIVPTTPGSVQFERGLPGQINLRKKFILPSPPDKKDNYVAQLEVDFQNTGTAAYSNPGYFLALGSARPLHANDMPNYTRVTWCIDGKAKYTDVSWFGEQNYPFIGVQKRAAQQYSDETLKDAEWVGVSNQFFVSLITPLNTKATRVWSTRFEAGKKRTASPTMASKPRWVCPVSNSSRGKPKTLKFQLYLGPKLYHRLAQLTHDEAEIMDFGLWKLICQALLNLMNFLHSYLHNYALAILVLTALVRLVLWPIQTKSYKSMRRMSALAPKMQELKEKYKDDPTKMNAEVMKLYKTYGVNPISGCLPMVIQIPIFFGLFTMLRQAVELRNASFLWVHDLSQPDTVAHLPGLGWPINILPILMAATQSLAHAPDTENRRRHPAARDDVHAADLRRVLLQFCGGAGFVLYNSEPVHDSADL